MQLVFQHDVKYKIFSYIYISKQKYIFTSIFFIYESIYEMIKIMQLL